MMKDSEYRLICENSRYAIVFYSFERDEISVTGCFEEYFDFKISKHKDIEKFAPCMDESYKGKLLDALYIEKSETAAKSKYGSNMMIECESVDHKKWFRFVIMLFTDENGNPVSKMISAMDITREKEQLSELLYMAYYDSITGIYNRNYFVSLLGGFIGRAEKESKNIGLMLIDIDDFKRINDGYGIIVGDEVLQQVGTFLHGLENDRVIACHLANDVFCIAIYDAKGRYAPEKFYEKISNRMRNPFKLSTGQEVNISVSAGVAVYPDDAKGALDLIKCAEIVMFRSKQAGSGGIKYFEAPILNDFLCGVEIESKLKEAVFKNNFVMYFQPQYYAQTKKLRGLEALVRWKDEEKGIIPPATFIPVAEKNGAIIQIGNFVVEESIKQYAIWSRGFDIHFQLSINISALQYKKDDFVDMVMGLVRKYNVDPSDIELEITESILIDDFDEVTNKLSRLRNFGIRISLDDFGTGYSSLSYLKRFPIDTLKVDKTFVDTVLSDSSTRIITESILSMSHSMGFETVAEGVENERQFDYLKAVGCDVIQGFYLGKPQPHEEIEMMLREL